MTFARRSFLQVAGGSTALAWWLKSAVTRAAEGGAPKRLIIIQRPNGTVREDWVRNGQPGPILAPFSSVWPYAVALQGVNVRPSNGSTSGSHEAGLLTIMTGGNLGSTQRTNDDFRSTKESLDQTLARTSPILSLGKVKTVQMGAHGTQDGGCEVPNCTMSYSGPSQPLYPVLNPSEVYKRLFGDTIVPGGSDPNAAALASRKARRTSVLDFVKSDLARVRTQYPASLKDELDAHEAAIRELEKSLDGGGTTPSACGKPTVDSALRGGGDYNNVDKVGSLLLKIAAAAFQCDLTRIVTFQWATGASALNFGPLGTGNHHSTSHNNNRGVLSAVDKWYSERTAAFIQQLVSLPDVGGGKLIDNTLVWYINEVSEGWNHSFDDYPFLFFGGDGVGLKQRGRVMNVGGQNKTSNDIWTAMAPVFGTTLAGLPTKAGGSISGLFTV